MRRVVHAPDARGLMLLQWKTFRACSGCRYIQWGIPGERLVVSCVGLPTANGGCRQHRSEPITDKCAGSDFGKCQLFGRTDRVRAGSVQNLVPQVGCHGCGRGIECPGRDLNDHEAFPSGRMQNGSDILRCAYGRGDCAALRHACRRREAGLGGGVA